jgi:hypothetical protein
LWPLIESEYWPHDLSTGTTLDKSAPPPKVRETVHPALSVTEVRLLGRIDLNIGRRLFGNSLLLATQLEQRLRPFVMVLSNVMGRLRFTTSQGRRRVKCRGMQTC